MKKILALLALVMLLSIAVVADGTDPMPLCRPSPTRGCPKPL